MSSITIEDYINELKSSSPTPGGGSGNCQLAKIAISLALMSINVSKNRKSFEKRSEEEKEFVNNSIEDLENIMKELDILNELDEKAFNDFMVAYKAKDQEKIAEASKDCYSAPLDVYLSCSAAVDVIIKLKDFIVSTIISDYKISLKTMSAVLENCLYNLDINVPNLKDDNLININNEIHRSCKSYLGKINRVLRGMK